MKSTILKIYTALAFTFITAFQAQAQVTKVEIAATGLTCSMCSNAINKQLKALNEVDRIETDLNTNTFIIFFKENQSVSPKTLKDGVEKAGFFVGSMIVTTQPNTTSLESNGFVFVDDASKDSSKNKFQILDKGYVTQKQYKKLAKTYAKHSTFLNDNENDYHIKAI